MRRFLNYLLLISIPVCAAILIYGYYAQSSRVSKQADYVVYLFDARSNTSSPLDIASIRAHISPGNTGYQIVNADQIATTPDELLHNAHSTADKSSLFIEIQPPYSESKKRLRSKIENAMSSGRERKKLLRRIIPVRRIDAINTLADCHQLTNDIIYASDNFRGLGIRIEDDSLTHLAHCGHRKTDNIQ